MGGYFNDGTVNVEIGEHAFATPAASRRSRSLDVAGRPSTVLDDGGGMLTLQVTGQRLRANLGDAEKYIYDLLVSLAGSTPGVLGCEDQLGHRAAFSQAVCIAGSGEVQAFKFADLRLEVLSPEKQAEPAWGAIPAAPGTYPGTSTLLDYSVSGADGAGGIALGTHPSGMRIEMARQYPLREIPRARGARSRGPSRGAVIRLTVSSHAVASGIHLARYLEDLARSAGGGRPVDLTGNGNTYEDVVLESLKPKHTDFRATTFEAEFLKQL
jgi:hypothetical protein